MVIKLDKGIFLPGTPRFLPCSKIVTRMLMRDIFAVANLLVSLHWCNAEIGPVKFLRISQILSVNFP